MSLPKKVSGFCLLLALAGCGSQQVPAAQPSIPPAEPENRAQIAASARLRAVIRDRSFVEQLPEAVRRTTISRPFSGRMVVLYTVDDGGAARWAQEADLAESGVTRDALRLVTNWNLSSVLRDPVSCTSHPVGEPAHGHYYESSRLLLDKQWAELAASAGTVVVAVPSNDTLIVACNPTPAVLQQLSVLVQNSYPQSPRPVSPSLLTWSQGRWRELPAP
jgi:uncharacterized protein YtpQ (UPF0354 family)